MIPDETLFAPPPMDHPLASPTAVSPPMPTTVSLFPFSYPAEDLGVRVLHEARQLVEEANMVLLAGEEDGNAGVLHGEDL